MNLDKEGNITHFDTPVGSVSFTDANGAYEIQVYVTGEFWRVVEMDTRRHGYHGALPGLTPKAAKALSMLLMKGQAIAEQETKKLRWKPVEDNVKVEGVPWP